MSIIGDKGMNKLAIIYNICGLKNGHSTTSIERVDYYINCVESLLKQDLDGCRIIISSCLNSKETRQQLVEHFGDKVSYNWIDTLTTVNQSFNHTVEKCVEHFGEFEGYLYVDSGILFGKQKDVIRKAYNLFKSGPYSMVTIQSSNDTGFPEWFNHHGWFMGQDYIIPVGRACNLHTQLFGNQLLKEYGRVMGDIFVAYCSESIFSFMCAAIKTKWIIMKDVILQHMKSLDGATAGFDHQGPRKCGWNNIWGGRDIMEMVRDKDAIASGLGYECLEGIMMPDMSQYDKDGFSINPLLKEQIKKWFFLKKEEFDYEDIKYEFIK